jgi:hypothetical protein
MTVLNDIENVEAVELDLEEQRKVKGGQVNHVGTGTGEKSYSTVTDYIDEDGTAWHLSYYEY